MNAELQFEFEQRRDQTFYRKLKEDPPWKVVRGFSRQGECLVHLNNISGGVFGGDSLCLNGILQPHTRAILTTTGATRIYRPRSIANEVFLHSSFSLAENSLLEYLPDPLIPYRGVRATQKTTFSLEAGATLFAWDTIAPGRVAHGEWFAYERLKLINEVYVQGVPVLIDRLLLEPAAWPMSEAARYGSNGRYLVSFLAIQAGGSTEAMKQLESKLQEVLAMHAVQSPGDRWGVSLLPEHGLLVRGIVASSLNLPSLLNTLWSHSKLHMLGRASVAPRKTL